MVEDNKTDLVLTLGEFAFVIDNSKGAVSVAVGPHQKNLTTGSEAAVRYNSATDRLEKCNIGESSRRFPTAKQGQYIVLRNPAESERKPSIGAISAAIELQMGFRVNIAGPTSFPLWPMQVAEVIDGHVLRTDQYLIVEVYDEQGAEANKGKGFTPRKTPLISGPPTEANTTPKFDEYPTTLGHRFVVKGTQVACYIPPTGYEVVPEVVGGKTSYVRTAVSLERLEYCTLLDEDGKRRIEQGPQVVFPKPTETFVTESKDGNVTAKFKAIELDAIKGLYIKVTEDYEEGDTKHKRGDELFITGNDQRIYFPRPEHSFVRYGDNILHYGIAIPLGEGRYVLDRVNGNVALVVGPRTFLPNPIKEVIAQRILTPREVRLFYPGNAEVEQANASLREKHSDMTSATTATLRSSRGGFGDEDRFRSLVSDTPGAGATSFNRGTNYTPPRSVTLGGRFEGAVKINVWPGYAVMVVSGDGKQHVIQGPSTTLLKYDETLHRFCLSTGTPKTDKSTIEGVYLQTTANSVSDLVEVETKDLCSVKLRVSYRVNFEGENKEKWFSVSDYVALLTTTLRSLLRKAAKSYGVLELQQKVADIVRDTILGTADGTKGRPGRAFEENAMRVYDVDVLEVVVGDQTIAAMIGKEQLQVFSHNIALSDLERSRQLALARATAELEKTETAHRQAEAALEAAAKENETRAKNAADTQKHEHERNEAEAQARKAIAEIDEIVAKARLELAKLEDEARTITLQKQTEIEVSAYEKRVAAVGEKLAQALIHVGDAKLMEAVSTNLSVQHLLGGGSLVDIIQKAIGGSELGETLKKLLVPKAQAGS